MPGNTQLSRGARTCAWFAGIAITSTDQFLGQEVQLTIAWGCTAIRAMRVVMAVLP